LKKLTDSIRFRFYKPETEKTKPNPNRKKPEKKPSQTGFSSKKTNRTETGQFELVSVFKKK
jgi:hypothetical protein